MQFITYLDMMQEKYGTTNAEILEELRMQGIAITKSNLSHKLKGDRMMSDKELDVLLQVIRPTASEEETLRRLYRIYQFGERNFEEVQRIKAYIEQFEDDTTVLFSPPSVDLSTVSDINDETLLADTMFAVLSEAWGREPIRIFCQPDCKPLMDMLQYLGRTQPAEIAHLVCFNNDYKSDKNAYNIQCLSVLDKLVIRNIHYGVRYFYDNVSAKTSIFSPLPFFVAVQDKILLLSADCKTGYLTKERGLVDRMNREFEQMYVKAQELFQVMGNELEFMQICAELEQQIHEKYYTLQYHPCVVFNQNADITARSIRDDFPYKEELLQIFVSRWQSCAKGHALHLHTQGGLQEFLSTGMTSDMDPAVFQPATPEDRQYVLEHMADNHRNAAINDAFVKVPKGLEIVCYDNGTVMISYKYSNQAAPRLLMRERSLYKSLMQFLEYVLKYELKEPHETAKP